MANFMKIVTQSGMTTRALFSLRRGYATAPTTKMFLDGKFVESKTNDWIDLHNPATNEV